MHFVVSFLNISIDAVHSLMRVALASGKLAGLHVELISFSQLKSVSVKLVSCFAPLVSFNPAQEREDLLPPPSSTNLRAIGPKAPFLSDFFDAMPDCFSILAFCFSKFVVDLLILLVLRPVSAANLARVLPRMVH